MTKLNAQTNCILVIAALVAFFSGPKSSAQNSSLLHDAPPMARATQPMFPYTSQPNTMQPYAGQQDVSGDVTSIPAGISGDDPRAMLSGASWTYQPAPPVRVFRQNDIVTIRVDEVTRTMAQGSVLSRKQTLFEAVISDWVRLDNFRVQPDPQPGGDPSVAGESQNQFRSQALMDSRELVTFNIAATIVDIRPNGSLVLEARKNIRVNDNLWETALSGICRPEDIAPDNVVLSRDLIDLAILKEDQGHLRDSYKRGWFSRWFDRVQPF